jgi:hypothetical protein
MHTILELKDAKNPQEAVDFLVCTYGPEAVLKDVENCLYGQINALRDNNQDKNGQDRREKSALIIRKAASKVYRAMYGD